MKKLWEWHSEEIVRNPNKLKTISMKDNNIYTSNESFESDIQIICKAFLIGKRFYNDNGMRSIMNMMINKYSIDTKRRPPGTTVDNRTITIPRIASAFPVVTVDLGYKGHGIVRVDSKDLIGVEWPRAFLTPNIASIIPKDLNDKPLAQLLMLSVEAHALNPRIKTSKKPINLTYLYQCLMNSYKSDIVDKDVQLKKCKEWGIIDANNQLIPEIRDSKQACISMIRARKSGDPALEKIIQDL
ncbi:uncharacterized protein [Prorops nasuta]|uniref:uncharacterized protein n=1 Tax=Prorops nasuta TaxID=863751 RepID=UPI0034CDFC7D